MNYSYFIITLFLCNVALAQNSMSKQNQTLFLDKLSKEIDDNYFDKEISVKITESLSSLSRKAKPIRNAQEFIDTVNFTLQRVANDNHLRVYFDPEKFNNYLSDELERSAFEFKRAELINFGFTKVEILDGNIGYFEIVKFSGFIEQAVKDKIASAMNLLQNTNALIIDLRKNNGGDGRVGDLLSSYFYSDKITFTNSSDFNSQIRYLNKPVYLLTGENTFSAAEGFCNSMQEYNRAVVIGSQTRGGGNSGASVPILEGILCFIPDRAIKSDHEARVIPNFDIPENNALVHARYLFYKEQITKPLQESELSMLNWNLKTCEYILKISDIKEAFDTAMVGKYEGNRTLLLKNETLLIDLNGSEYHLIPTKKNEFIMEGFDDRFGIGNRRIRLKNDGIEEVIYLNGQFLNKFWRKIL